MLSIEAVVDLQPLVSIISSLLQIDGSRGAMLIDPWPSSSLKFTIESVLIDVDWETASPSASGIVPISSIYLQKNNTKNQIK